MADTWVLVVGHAPFELDIKVGDNLLIAFCSNYRFCVTSGNPEEFDPPLPNGQDFSAGAVWPGNGAVSVAKTAGTISWERQNEGVECCSGVESGGGHSIIVNG